jgi:phosphotransferase system HPr-like phosphotransfer protein
LKTIREITKAGIPLDVFPHEVRDFISNFARGSGSQESYVSSAVLACAAGLCDHHSLVVKSGFIERSNFFLAIVGAPGVTKSAPISMALSPLMDIEEEKNADYKAKEKKWRTQMKDKTLTKQQRDALKESQPERPYCKVITDGSIEAMFLHLESMADAKKTAHCVFVKDELKGFFGGMDKYKSKGGDEYENWLSLFSGSTVTKTLVNRTVFIAKARATVIGGIQPEVYNQCMGDKGDGMIDRFMIAIYEGDPKATQIRLSCSADTIKKYKDFMLAMGDQEEIEFSFWRGADREKMLDAIQVFHDWCHQLGIQYETGAFKKWEQCFYRLCIVLAALWDKKEMDIETVKRGVDLASFYAVDWLKAKVMAEKGDDEKLKEKIVKFLKSEPLNRRDIQRKTRTTKEKAVKILSEMVTDGDIIRINTKTEQESTAIYELPEVIL